MRSGTERTTPDRPAAGAAVPLSASTRSSVRDEGSLVRKRRVVGRSRHAENDTNLIDGEASSNVTLMEILSEV